MHLALKLCTLNTCHHSSGVHVIITCSSLAVFRFSNCCLILTAWSALVECLAKSVMALASLSSDRSTSSSNSSTLSVEDYYSEVAHCSSLKSNRFVDALFLGCMLRFMQLCYVTSFLSISDQRRARFDVMFLFNSIKFI